VKGNRCQRDITEKESFTYLGETLCDDCYMDTMSPAKPCDHCAVYSDTRARESSGLKGEEGLTPFQKEIYEFIRVVAKGKKLGRPKGSKDKRERKRRISYN
jgi:hypothetical protein